MSIANPGTDGPRAGPSGIPLPETRVSRALDRVIVLVGEGSAWIWTILMLLIVYQVTQRYVFGLGSIKLEEAEWHLYAAGFMLAIPFAELRERHIRIDVLAEHWPLRRRLWVELFGLVVFLLPFSIFAILYSAPYVAHSLRLKEISAAPDGLPMVYILKGFIVATFILLAMVAISRLSRVVAAMRRT
jgi:TRAP-type mannitol/chloroaromatic compound transport system permease small subunit